MKSHRSNHSGIPFSSLPTAMSSDLQHILDLCSLYYPSHPPPTLKPSLLCSTPPATNPFKQQLIPYTCCNTTFSKLDYTLSHFFENHFPSIRDTIRDKKTHIPKAKQLTAVGNKNISIVQRTATFLKLFSTLPSNPRNFRPAPHSRSPFEFKNPYTSATALAYDFIETFQQNPKEYSEFTLMLNMHTSISDYHDTWHYWAHYIYPHLHSKDTLFNESLLFTSPSEIYDGSNQPQTTIIRLDKHFKHYSFTCPFKPCPKLFTSNPGFRIHMLKQHLQKKHFYDDLISHSPPKDITYTCPTMRCSKPFRVKGELRRHILHKHFTTHAKSLKNQ
ncbi:hypothetical protein DSO57_1024962 [Entomophthora muscae]|uniref:Uncharacterized protein n=1 Tax=Entomophthora muscae TaxID=34485 RepID=A0ACC2RTJ4_9FUNG|nr:hypothetical protein DSO57_1024962 [Entomophthora muscae]